MTDSKAAPSALTSLSWADEEDEFDPVEEHQEPEPVELPPTPSHTSLSRQSSALSRQSSQGSTSGSKPIPNQPPFRAFVGNLSFKARDADLRDLFQGVKSIDWQQGNDGRPTGRAIIEFVTRDNLVAALAHHGRMIMDREIRVDVAGKSQGSYNQNRSGPQDERAYHQRGDQRDLRDQRDPRDHRDTRDHRDQRGGEQRHQWNDRPSGDDRSSRPQSYDRERRDNSFDNRGSYQDRRDTRDSRYNDKPRREYSAAGRRDSDTDRERPAPLTREISSTSSTGGDLPSGASTPAGGAARPKLVLAPRTVATPTAAAANIQDTKGIFGGARPREAIVRTESSGSIASESPVASPAHAQQSESGTAAPAATLAAAQTKTETNSSPSNSIRLMEGVLTSLPPTDVANKPQQHRPTNQQRGGRTTQQSNTRNERAPAQPQQSAEDSEWQQGSKNNPRGARTVGRGGAAAAAPKKPEQEDTMSKPTNQFAALSMDDDANDDQ